MKNLILILKTIALFSFMLPATMKAQPANCQAAFTYQSTGPAFYFYGNSGSGVTYNWTFGDGDSANVQFPVHTYASPGTYYVCLTTFDSFLGCTDTYCMLVTYAAPPTCSATFTALSNGATNSLMFVSNYVTTTALYLWDFNDGSSGTGTVINHIFTSPGIYNVCLTVIDSLQSCSTTVCTPVTITMSTSCQALFTYNSSPIMFPAVSFFDASSGIAVNWSWDFGDGDSSNLQNPVHTYVQAGNYYVCLTITTANGCTSTMCNIVPVTTGGNQCNANYAYQISGNTLSFVSNGAAYSHNWSFGDGTFSFLPNPVHTYGAPGAYQVCHTVYDSMQTCSSTYCDTISINSGGNCTASFLFTVDSTGYLYSFVNTSTSTLGNLTWSFGDGTGSNINSPSHQYLTAGVHIVCLTYTNPATGNILCSSCATIVTGNGANPCMPVFYSFPDSNIIGNGNVHFGIFNTCLNTQLIWNFGDSTTGSGPNPTHLYNDSGWYYVCVTAFTPSGNYTYCDSVYAFRFTTSINETANAYGLNVYPNPLAGEGQARFTLLKSAHVSATIIDMQGRIKTALLSQHLSAGMHTLALNTNGLQNGIYILTLNINDFIVHQRISVVN